MSILDDIKSVTKTIQQIDNIELYQKILGLQADIMGLIEENNLLKNENNSLKEKLRVKGSLKFEQNRYWIENSDGTKDGPFCSKCWDVDNKLVRLTFYGHSEYLECANCKRYIKNP